MAQKEPEEEKNAGKAQTAANKAKTTNPMDEFKNLYENDYASLKSALDADKLTVDDILGSSEKQLVDELDTRGVKGVRQAKFIRAVKMVPWSKMNESNGM